MMDWNGNGKIDPVDIGIDHAVSHADTDANSAASDKTEERFARSKKEPAKAGCLTVLLMTAAIALLIFGLLR